MKVIKPSVEFITPVDGSVILSRIEQCGRVCYKSEGKIMDGSAEAFCRGIIKRGHEAVLEHCSFTVKFICDRGVSHEIVYAFWKKSLSLYLGTDDEKKITEVEKKAMVIGFTRILRRAVRKMKPGSEEQTATMKNARNILAQLLEEVDSLAV